MSNHRDTRWWRLRSFRQSLWPPPLWTVRIAWLLVALVGAFIVVWVILHLIGLSDTVNDPETGLKATQSKLSDAQSELDRQARDIHRQAAAIEKANRKLEKHGIEPVKVPVVGPAGTQGPAGPGPTDEQVRAAVSFYCSSTGVCDGRSPTSDQVFTAVVTYCNARGQCMGQDGTDGAPGPAPTDAQVASAVNAYCTAHDGCGVPGPPGPPGVVNAQDQCEFAAGQFVRNVGITYADQTITLTCDTGDPPALVVTCSYVSFWAYPSDPSAPGAPVPAQQYTVATDCK